MGMEFAQLAGCFDQRVRELQGCASLLHTASGSEQLESICRSLSAVAVERVWLNGAFRPLLPSLEMRCTDGCRGWRKGDVHSPRSVQ